MDVHQWVALYEKEISRPPQDVVVPVEFWYIHYKSFIFLKQGPDEYRRLDALGQPPERLPELALSQLFRGAAQVLEYRGLAPTYPLEGLTVGGFHSLLRLFHFRTASQSAHSTGDAHYVVDKMEMVHIVDGRAITLYNKVALGSAAKVAADCPYCGRDLRTRFAKQCRHCGSDWHDADNVVRRPH